MRALSIFLFVFSLSVQADIAAEHASTSHHASAEYQHVNLLDFYTQNQIPEDMAAKKQRVMLPPKAIQFEGWAMALAKPGKFSLVYDALSLWSTEEDLPKVTHSAFISAKGAPVLPVYVAEEAAKHIEAIGVKNMASFYAVHIYNYAKGPRLVIVAASKAKVDH